MQFAIETIKNKPIESNCFVIYNNVSLYCIIIDPGTEDCSDLLFFLNQNKLVPDYVILTHEHFDHIWGVNKLLELYPCVVVCSEKCMNLISDRKKNLSLFYDQLGFEIKTNKFRIVVNGTSKLGSFTFQFRETLGHSVGSIIFWIDESLFVGDLVIKNRRTVTRLPGGNKIQLQESFNEIIRLFNNSNMVVYPGHGAIFCLNEVDLSQLL
jgi:hydroxyacylglutathione hydrolase